MQRDLLFLRGGCTAIGIFCRLLLSGGIAVSPVALHGGTLDRRVGSDLFQFRIHFFCPASPIRIQTDIVFAALSAVLLSGCGDPP